MKGTLRLTFILLLVQSYNLSASILYVSAGNPNPTPPYTTWATAATNIQNAIDVAGASDLVLVTNGTYSGGLFVGKPLSLLSVNGPLFTSIDGGGTNRCITIINQTWMQGFTLTNGWSSTDGGAVWSTSWSAFLTNCILRGNCASNGGGAFQAMLYSCLLTGNCASNGAGGGAYFCDLYNCTAAGNSAAKGGGAFGGTLYNTIIYYNTATNGTNYTQISNIINCCMTPDPGAGGGTITNAPQFVDYAGGNLRLQPTSPCVDAGNNLYPRSQLDLDGNPRISGAAVDMGAYEYSPGAGTGTGGSYVMNFQFSGFAPSNGNPAPTDPVIGSISWRAAKVNGPIQGFDAIGLTLDGHTYSPNELHYLFEQYPGSSKSVIYSNPLGPSVGSLTDEFSLVWDRASLQPFYFAYGSSRRSGIWILDNLSSFTSFSIISHAEPVIATQPLSQTVVAGTNVNLSVGASGSLPLYWQWMFNGNTIPDATNSSLELPSVVLGQAGIYSVIVSNVFGVKTSSNANLTVLLAGTKYVWLNSPNPTAPYTNWTTAAHGIQEAVDVSVAGDTLLVTNGVYASGWRKLDYDYEQNRVIVPLPITLRSINGPQVTIIDGGGTNRCLLMTNGSLLSGFTLTNGGGIGGGGGVSGFWSNGGASGGLLTNCVLAGNRAYSGGAALGCTLSSCILTGNSISGSTNGCAAANCTLYNCILLGNSGAMSAVVDACDLYSCLVTSNSAVGANRSTLHSCALTGNQGVAVMYGRLYNCTLAANSWGAIESQLLNCIVYYNSASGGQNYDASCTLEYCCTTPMPGSGLGNITTEPALTSDWRLSSTSPCRGAGSAAYSSGLDLDGEPWLSPPSIGCDEFYSGSLTGVLSVASTASWTNVPTGFTVTFDGTVQGRASDSRWEFGDGTVESNRLHTSHQWAASGDYSVVLRAYNRDNSLGVATALSVHVYSQGPVLHVDANSAGPIAPYTNWNTAARSIQDALAAVFAPRSTVLVTNGTYGPVTAGVEVALLSVNGPQFTTIDGGGTNRCATLTTNASLSGFTLTNGWAGSGGAVWCQTTNSYITNCMLVGNSAYHGGGIYGGVLYNCALRANSGTSGGGANSAILYNCTLAGNLSQGGGGAAFCTLYKCTLTSNIATNGGGAYQCSLSDCILSSNLGFGAAANSTLYNCLLNNNAMAAVSGSTLYNCTVAGNSSGGAYFSTLYNCILYYNDSSGANYDGYCTLNYCCTTPMPTNGAGNITNEPVFIDSAKGDFHLYPSSPCVNAGNNAFVSGSLDLDGASRIVGGTVDIGTFEVQVPGPPGPPFIYTQPLSQNVYPGSNVTLKAAAVGQAPMSWQWWLNSTPIPNATNTSLSLQSVTTNQAGNYVAVITNILGSTTSHVGVLTVLTAPSVQVSYVALDSPNPTPPYNSWATAAHTIQDAVDAAGPGDTIVVTNGVYADGGRIVPADSKSSRVMVGKAVTVRSVNGPLSTIIKGAGMNYGPLSARCAYLVDGAVLSGFTLAGGAADLGGGVYCVSTNASLTNCIVMGNMATWSGGGVAWGTLYNCTLSNNSAGSGGGASESILIGCRVTGNSATAEGGGANGGGLYNCVVTGNLAAGGGGASSATLNNCTLTGNAASVGGGVGGCTLNNCIVYYNTASSGANYWGFPCTFAYSCTTPLPPGPGNLENEPLLASSTHLSAQSPCIGRGSAAYSTGLDMDGEPWQNPPCIGADQFVAGQNTGPLAAGIGASYAKVSAGFAVQFQALIDGRLSSSIWDFGDGMVVSNHPYASHVWTQPGTYTVQLISYNDSYPNGINTTMVVEVDRAQVYYVSGSNPTPTPPYTNWPTAAANIQDAIDAGTQIGRLVLVGEGVYTNGVREVYGLESSRVVVAEGVEVRSVHGPSVTVIEGVTVPNGNYGYGFRCAYVGTNSVLSGFTLTNGHASMYSTIYGRGGGAWCELSAVITNCVLIGNFAGMGGGSYGGTLNNCTFRSNSVFSGAGGAYRATLNDCLLAGNSGGGADSCTLNRCTLTGNSASTGGGAADSILNDCVLKGNSASPGSLYGFVWDGLGGGAYGGILNDCTLFGNSANVGSGAMNATLNNCTISGNLGLGGGPALSGATVNNCVVYFNNGINYANCTFNYCCTIPLPASGSGNIDLDPQFVDGPGGNLRLRFNSPCINSGNNALAFGNTDLDGNPRIVSGTVDIGAYEYQGAGSAISYAWLQQYGLPTDGSADHSDPDSDGFNNWQEWICGTDPTNALSCLRLVSAVVTSTNVTVTWQSVAGMNYFLERSTNLTSPFSVVTNNIVGQAGTTSRADTNAIGPGPFFYRVGVGHP